MNIREVQRVDAADKYPARIKVLGAEAFAGATRSQRGKTGRKRVKPSERELFRRRRQGRGKFESVSGESSPTGATKSCDTAHGARLCHACARTNGCVDRGRRTELGKSGRDTTCHRAGLRLVDRASQRARAVDIRTARRPGSPTERRTFGHPRRVTLTTHGGTLNSWMQHRGRSSVPASRSSSRTPACRSPQPDLGNHAPPTRWGTSHHPPFREIGSNRPDAVVEYMTPAT